MISFLLISALIYIVSFLGITVFVWYMFWKERDEYTMYDILFGYPSDIVDDDTTSLEDSMVILKFLPVLNVVVSVIVLILVIVSFFVEVSEHMVNPLKKIKFHSVTKTGQSQDEGTKDNVTDVGNPIV